MIVVSDASPLISLSAVHQLHLLERLYGQVLIPEAVAQEILRGDPGKPGSTQIREETWIRPVPVQDQVLCRALEGELDWGEAEAIALAAESRADLLLIDERRGRLAAKRLGLAIMGTLGVLVEAKLQRLLPAVAPVLDNLLLEAGFRISPQLYRQALEAADELL